MHCKYLNGQIIDNGESSCSSPVEFASSSSLICSQPRKRTLVLIRRPTRLTAGASDHLSRHTDNKQHPIPTMASYFSPGANPNQASTRTPSPVRSPLSPPIQRSNALSNRLTSVLSASYADSDIRDALETLSIRGVHNTAETRRQLRLDVQKEVVDCNAEIVRDFGQVAEVSLIPALFKNEQAR